jgi:hypothetical protein
MRIQHRLSILLLVCLLLGGCAKTAEPSLSPQEVVTSFFRWYIGYPGNPLRDGEYRTSPYLAEAFVAKVDEILASFDRGGFDPFLLAQDIPEQFTVNEAIVSENRASVTVDFYWTGNPVPTPRQVELELLDGEWKITGIAAYP